MEEHQLNSKAKGFLWTMDHEVSIFLPRQEPFFTGSPPYLLDSPSESIGPRHYVNKEEEENKKGFNYVHPSRREFLIGTKEYENAEIQKHEEKARMHSRLQLNPVGANQSRKTTANQDDRRNGRGHNQRIKNHRKTAGDYWQRRSLERGVEIASKDKEPRQGKLNNSWRNQEIGMGRHIDRYVPKEIDHRREMDMVYRTRQGHRDTYG